MMPLIIRKEEVTWSQTPHSVVMKVPIKGIKANRTNIVTSNNYIRVHFHPFIFEVFLWGEVDDERGSCTIDEEQNVIVFEMAKVAAVEEAEAETGAERNEKNVAADMIVEWACLEKEDLSRNEKRVLRDRAVELTQKRHAERRKQLEEKRHEQRQMAVRDQIHLDGRERQRIAAIKQAESEKALNELHEWSKGGKEKGDDDDKDDDNDNDDQEKNQLSKLSKQRQEQGQRKVEKTEESSSSSFSSLEFPLVVLKEQEKQEERQQQKEKRDRHSHGDGFNDSLSSPPPPPAPSNTNPTFSPSDSAMTVSLADNNNKIGLCTVQPPQKTDVGPHSHTHTSHLVSQVNTNNNKNSTSSSSPDAVSSASVNEEKMKAAAVANRTDNLDRGKSRGTSNNEVAEESGGGGGGGGGGDGHGKNIWSKEEVKGETTSAFKASSHDETTWSSSSFSAGNLAQSNSRRDGQDRQPIRQLGRIAVTFTPREFSTPSRESTAVQEQEFLKKQAEARKKCGFNDSDLRPEERDPTWLLEKGASLMKAGSYLGAVSAYSLGIKIAPKMPELYTERAGAHLALNNLVKTVEDASQGLSLLTPKIGLNAGDRLKCHVARARAFHRLKCYREAVMDYKEAVSLDPNDERVNQDFEKCEATLYKMSQDGETDEEDD